MGVVLSTLKAMADRWNTAAGAVHAAIGPGIGPCCFEVGPEVAVQFGKAFERTGIDLAEANRRQLTELGVGAKRIYSAGLCTFCNPAEFHSFRRDREAAGRIFSVIGLKTLRARD